MEAVVPAATHVPAKWLPANTTAKPTPKQSAAPITTNTPTSSAPITFSATTDDPPALSAALKTAPVRQISEQQTIEALALRSEDDCRRFTLRNIPRAYLEILGEEAKAHHHSINYRILLLIAKHCQEQMSA